MTDFEYELLVKENQELREQITKVENTTSELCNAFSQFLKVFSKEQENIYELRKSENITKAKLSNLKYEINDIVRDRGGFSFPKFMSNEETIRLIIEEKKSMGRFGDGEFSIAFDIERQKFQRLDEKLKNRIWEVLNTKNDDYLIAIADNYGCLNKYTDQAADGIRLYMTEETRSMHEKILPSDYVFADAYITRPYVMYRDNCTQAPRERFDLLKTIWNNRNIVLVEGAQTRLGVGNDLFDNTKSIRRILAPATSSFDRYDEILEACKSVSSDTDIFLLAIGPASGVLAYDLSLAGNQGIDVGHIDIEYEWFLAGEGRRTVVKNKYNNEVLGGDCVEEEHDPLYEKQIIYRFF